MSFAPWFAINHAFARPPLDPATAAPPRSAQAIAAATAIVAPVVVFREEEEAIFPRSSFGSEMMPEANSNFCHF